MKWQSGCISFRYYIKVIKKKNWSIFLFVKCTFLFFKVANDQWPAADSELVMACLINLDMINISIKSFKLVLN